MPNDKSITQSTLFGVGEELRICNECRERKSHDQYYIEKKRGKGARKHITYKRLSSKCMKCTLDLANKWAKDHPDQVIAIHRRSHLKRCYGVTQAKYDAMFEAQNGLCAICKETESYKSPRSGRIVPLSIDHDHATGQIRALLCHRCNTCLGKFKDDPAVLRAAADYLERHLPNVTPGYKE